MRGSIVIGLVFAAGCGGMAAPDVEGYDAMRSDMAAAVDRHCGAAMPTREACATEVTRYTAEVRPMSEDLEARSGSMDECMGMMGHDANADMRETCLAAMSELERHERDGCTGADDATRAAEMTRHCDAMRERLGRMGERTGSLRGMMQPGGMMAGGTCGE